MKLNTKDLKFIVESVITELNNEKNYTEIYYFYNTKHITGDYISARSIGRPAGAKGYEIDSEVYYIIPEWVSQINIKDKININSTINWDEIDDEYDEDHIKVQTIQNNAKNGSVLLIPVLTQEEINGVETKTLIRGYFNKATIKGRNDINAENHYVNQKNKEDLQYKEQKEIDEIAKEIAKFIPNFYSNHIKKYPNNGYTVLYYSNSIDLRIRDFKGTASQLIQKVKEEYEHQVQKINQIKIQTKEREKERIGNNVIELSDGRMIPMINNSVKIPKWAAGHLIGSGGRVIKAVERKLGRRVNLITFDEKEPKKAGAEWLIDYRL